MHALIDTAPEEIRAQFRTLAHARRVQAAARYRPADHPARRGRARALHRRPPAAGPRDRDRGPHPPARLAHRRGRTGPAGPPRAGHRHRRRATRRGRRQPNRMRHEGSFVSLCDASPVQASSGCTTRHGLNRGGNRKPTAPCGASSSSGWAATPPPAPTSSAAPRKDSARPRSSAASGATSPGRSTANSSRTTRSRPGPGGQAGGVSVSSAASPDFPDG
jgi:hypothetical protein